MANLNHPNLVDVYDSGNVEGMLYIIMERVPGRTLGETAGGNPVDEVESAQLVAEVCRGLEHAHKAGNIHQGLNPGNILINAEAQAKIVDFGIAGLTGVDPGNKNSAYCAPEILQDNGNVDARADIYSLGVILYQLLTGKLPGDPYIPPSEASSSLPDFDEIVQRAIQRDPDKRYSTSGEMAQEIEELIKQLKSEHSQQKSNSMMTAAVVSSVPSTPNIKITKPSNAPAITVTLLVVCGLAAGAYFIIKPLLKEPVTEEKPPGESSATETTSKHREGGLKSTDKKPMKPSPPVLAIPKPAEPEPEMTEEISEETTEALAEAPQGSAQEPKPAPAPVPEPAPPEFDLDGYLTKAHQAMQEKGKTTIAEYDKDLQACINRFERKVKRLIRRGDRELRKAKELAAEETFEILRENGRLPSTPSPSAPQEFKDLYPEALDDQNKVEEKFNLEFIKLQNFYTDNLEAKIAELKEEGNDVHAEELGEEIQRHTEDIDHFIEILRVQNPDD